MDAGVKKERPTNPRSGANPFSVVTFFYTFPTFIQGFRKELEETDLPQTWDNHKSGKLGDRIENAWFNEEKVAKKKGRKPSMLRVLRKVFLWEFIFYGLLLLVGELGIRLVQPIALGQLISFYTSNGDNITKDEAYLYAGAVVLCSLLNVFFQHPYMLGCLHLGMKIRVACCSLVYRKALRLSKSALGQTTVGQLVNLLSNDVNRFDVALLFAHQLWVGPLETVIITYLMYLQVGWSAIVGVAFLLLFIPIQIYLGKRTSVLRLRTALRTDERVRLMNEIISGIQVIKMYTWEKPFAALVNLARRFEIKSIRGTSYVRGILLSFIMFTTRISIFVSVLTYVLAGYNITAEQVFVLTSFYGILRQNMTVFFPQGIGQMAEASVSVRRLAEFMMYNENSNVEKQVEIVDKDKVTINGTTTITPPSQTGVFVKNLTAKWTSGPGDNTLQDVSFTVEPGQLVAIIGPVGAGKTSLLHAILSELPLLSGSVDVNGEISYASQEPWLFAGTVRQNILFGQPLDRVRYKKVVKRCALERDFQLFPYGDKTIVGERGVSLSGGQRARINLARAVYKQADIYLMDDPLSAVDTHVGKELFDKCIASYLKEKTCILITHQLQYLKEVDHIIIFQGGKIQAQGNYKTLQESGLDFASVLQDESTEVADEPQELTKTISRQNSIASINSETIDVPKQTEESKQAGSVGAYVYSAYFKAGGNCCAIFFLFFMFILAQIAGSGGDYFITYWVNMEQQKNGTLESSNSELFVFDTNTCIYIYSAISVLTVVFTLGRSLMFFLLCMRSSTNLHDNMFQSITRAPMHFFNTNSSGRILNRFSKDMGAIDELLPAALIDCLQIGLALIGIIVVVAVISPYLMIPTVLIGIIFVFLRKFYLATGRSVKRLEGVTRSPVFAHLNASLQGLTTIRAFKAQDVLQKEFDSHQDLHSSAWFLFLSTSRAFGLWLDIVCVVYIAVVTISFLIGDADEFGGNVGLAITQAIGLTGMFQWGMRQSTELENQMTSVERVLEYSNLESERELITPPDKKPKKEWPEHGEVKFSKLYLTYNPNDPPVLRNLNFVIKPKDKVGIVGRTGAGKSSLIAALFQLTNTEGSIFIDDVDTKYLGLHDLRSKISIIPQEPVLFSGTMRKNLDPFDEYDDDVLWKALSDVELKDTVNDMAAGLNSEMSEGGSNFSVGQRQLVCLARAIIRNNKVLVLDEATANVDPHTDALIQMTIRRKFSECTVLTIAHRLNTIMDSDKVLVMDAGTMVEYDHPHLLLQNPKGVLYGMLEQTGRGMSDNLTQVAKKHYNETVHKEEPSSST
ncbi:PREDICTED: probable multidrug resistance-associated protein lethal(2)03659 isoform X2 [Nicrophorus vespilloides]|uniref:Probable multidrug resistance-associated protein lethal(2)03659 isoform X2 n=1 Tax=Nicrophorus vespilloides TaxID=110193 RepID=A0ABM1NJP8_NICVS|nr:PREDICTED: probable multidrug resistance-associated protein lethal(2)03659 isoform X2 [Nicrophorus vespilloides]